MQEYTLHDSRGGTATFVLSRVLVTIRRGMDWMIGFINTTRNYIQLQRYRYSPYFTVNCCEH
jgi:hypothetical protein